ncbi:MAG: TetR/AcrR family transcriptional regulator [Clostridia bacterium]|nr:TetR/AcrR family transcriptional regulator [Clostridia bacterium]
MAFEKFAQKGYNTTLSEIAQGAGIKKQSIYNHFENKDELLYETIKIELLSFYSTKSLEFDSYMDLEPKEALKTMYYSICDYYKDINKLKFWRWLLLIESKELFTKCRDLIRQNEGKFYNRVKDLLEGEIKKSGIEDEMLWPSIQTFVVMIQGVLDGMLLYHDVYDSQILIENTWNFYWKSFENMKGHKVS